ncbi:putative E3 ubiquitin-protein ligase RF298 [Andrographis paniculata]|uniref:putative E3 ubiquitin-protein ligase RF298 n=1 Tax=Andrographis paniculata TaxID=175694 RepID=UPI0021E72271|nr:putative E3 ubiquitin-protein ligase RF298 [Andrographis paniculata]
MASMVAKACSSTSSQMPVAMSACDKGSRNKRKFRADPPMADPTKTITMPTKESTSFEFSAEKFDSHRHHTNSYDFCCVDQNTSNALKLDLGLGTSTVAASRSREPGDDPHNANWSDFSETELEELVLKNLDTIFRSSVKKVVAEGYKEEVAAKAILRSGNWYGCKDTLSNIVDNALSFLRSGREIDPSVDHCFDDFQQMEKYVLAELVCLLKEVRPFFSTGDAMWHLLICDMNVSHACAVDGDSSGTSTSNENFSAPPRQLATELGGSESNGPIHFKAKAPASSNDGITVKSELKPSFIPNGLITEKDHLSSNSGAPERTFCATGMSKSTLSVQKFVASRKASGLSRPDYILQQKGVRHATHNRPKGASRSGKLRSYSCPFLDKKLKGVADSTLLNAKNSPFTAEKAVGFDTPADNNLSTNGFTSVPTFGVESSDHSSLFPKKSGVSSLPLPMVPFNPSPVTDTELSLSYTTKNIANLPAISFNAQSSIYNFNSTNDMTLEKWSWHIRKDDVIVRLVPRIRNMQNQLQKWTEWANQKVMQAARRLSKDKAELKSLRQEKEEIEKVKKEKQSLEESTTKKIYEMENALRKAGRQIEQYNAAGARLEIENATLRQEMEAAKLCAAESAASCREVSKREKNTLMKFQSWEKQKVIFQEELSAEKMKMMQLQQKLRQAVEIQDQVEGKLNQEVQGNEELLAQANTLRKEREKIEASTESKEATIKSRAEASLHKYKEDIARLEKDISQLRMKTDSSKIAALRRGIDGSYIADSKKATAAALKELSKMVTSADLDYFSGNGGVKRDRECVMCLSEEMSVVFLPCAHQVVCPTCNELHEKQGMKDCPSCRSPIQRRVSVRYANP